ALCLVVDLVLGNGLIGHHQRHKGVDVKAGMPVWLRLRGDIPAFPNRQNPLHFRDMVPAVADHHGLVRVRAVDFELFVYLHLRLAAFRAADIPEPLIGATKTTVEPAMSRTLATSITAIEFGRR